jgi:hypothetical protein
MMHRDTPLPVIFTLVGVLLAVPSEISVARDRKIPVGVTFQKDTLYRSDGRGDNWCITWAADGSQVTSMCDGNWLGGEPSFHNHLYRILGGPADLSRQDIPGYPQFAWGTGSWFGYGIVSVEGVLYATISKTPANHWSGPFRGLKLLRSSDNGATWYRVDRQGSQRKIDPQDEARNEVNAEEMFFLEESGKPHESRLAYPFSYVAFVQCGQDNSAAKDGYVYIYSPEGAHADKLCMARVPKNKIGIRQSWEYFAKYDGTEPVWTADIDQRGYGYAFPEKTSDGKYFGWYSWLPSIVWNEGLGLYIMVNGGTCAGRGMSDSDQDYYDGWMHTETGCLGFWYAEKPYGPWRPFYYTDGWTVDDPKNRTYQPKLSPKWISTDGRQMVLIWSDAMKNEAGRSHTVNYKWNQMQISIQTE